MPETRESDLSNVPELTLNLAQGFAELEVDQRIRDTPANAHLRGVFFNLAERALEEASADLLAVWRVMVGAQHRWAFKFYPARDCIREHATAAVLLNPTDPGDALRRMWSTTPRFSRLLRAERFVRYLTGNDPGRALHWLERNRGMMCDFGAWRVDITGPRAAIFHYVDEYLWIAHAHRGGVEGTLALCGVSPRISVELDSRYKGRLQISWD